MTAINSSLTYDPNRVTSTSTFQYDGQGRLTSRDDKSGSGTARYSFNYNAVGNVTSIDILSYTSDGTLAGNSTVSYEYGANLLPIKVTDKNNLTGNALTPVLYTCTNGNVVEVKLEGETTPNPTTYYPDDKPNAFYGLFGLLNAYATFPQIVSKNNVFDSFERPSYDANGLLVRVERGRTIQNSVLTLFEYETY